MLSLRNRRQIVVPVVSVVFQKPQLEGMDSNDIKDFATPAFGFAEKDEAWNSLKQYAKAIVSMNKCFQKKLP